ncbi:FAD-dependent oxidoreductase [Candidatus Obscuribacterales bacterium]|nr:FAD-dependent oxidoreductase [Candidatus Obscuribacterales bacterium]
MNSHSFAEQATKIVIVGGVAGGMSAAARARRLSEQAEIVVFERGEYVSYANCGLPYLLGGEIKSKDKLLVVKEPDLRKKLKLDIRANSEVVSIDPKAKKVSVRDLASGRHYEESYDELILAVGAAPIKPPIPGIDRPGIFSVRSIHDIEMIEAWIKQHKPKDVVVAGGGFIGLETAEQLRNLGLNVTIIDGKKQVLTPVDPEMAELVHAELREHGIQLILGSPISEFVEPHKISCIYPAPKSCWVQAGENSPVPADLVILGLGVRPETKLAHDAGIEIGKRGGIRVNAHLQTSTPHIWAVGDAIEVKHPTNNAWTLIALGGPANRQGRIVADNIFGNTRTYDGTIGTAILRVFELAAASVGLNEQTLKDDKIPYETVFIHPSHHAGYYPGAERLDMKVMFHRETGKLLGAQVVGKNGADKRIDVIATAMKAGLTIRDLAELELAYAPPFGSAKDPINLAGMVGTNILDGLNTQESWSDLDEELECDDICIIDVRTSAERKLGYIPNSVHIPLPDLRERIADVPPGKKVVTYCQSGQRSYMAYRLLSQKGFKAKNLAGGFLTWKAATGKVETEAAPTEVAVASKH